MSSVPVIIDDILSNDEMVVNREEPVVAEFSREECFILDLHHDDGESAV